TLALIPPCLTFSDLNQEPRAHNIDSVDRRVWMIARELRVLLSIEASIMRNSSTLKRLGWLALAAMLGWFAAKESGEFVPRGHAPAHRSPVTEAAEKTETPPRTAEDTSDDDRKAIMSGAKAFTDAFNKGDAHAIAAFWTEKGELRDASG